MKLNVKLSKVLILNCTDKVTQLSKFIKCAYRFGEHVKSLNFNLFYNTAHGMFQQLPHAYDYYNVTFVHVFAHPKQTSVHNTTAMVLLGVKSLQ